MPRNLLDADATEPTREEAEVLQTLERDRIVLLVTFLLLLPIGLGLAGERRLPNGWLLGEVWGGLCFGVYAVILLRWTMFTPCPRCGDAGKTAWWLFIFTRACFRCGLTLVQKTEDTHR